MTSEKKPAKDIKRAAKPIIVTSRPIMKDPMMTEGDELQDNGPKENLAHATGPKLQPLQEPAETPPAEEKSPAPKKIPTQEPEPPKEPAKTADSASTDSDKKPAPEDKPNNQDVAEPQQKADAEAARKKEQAAAVEKLVASRKYELPINTVEKRKAKHFAALGILLVVLLALAWGDIALDAGLIHVNGVKPATHFFSN